jgi:hypothetical protein
MPPPEDHDGAHMQTTLGPFKRIVGAHVRFVFVAWLGINGSTSLDEVQSTQNVAYYAI